MIKPLTPEEIRIRQLMRALADRERPPVQSEPSPPPRLDAYPQTLSGPALAAAVGAATYRPADPRPLVGEALLRVLRGDSR